MGINSRTIQASPERVWSVLADGWLYPVWVVGATRMRDVDANWPEIGAKIHHSAGVWPLVVNDHTEVLEADAPRHLKLRARGWPMGEAHVTLTLTPTGSGTQVQIDEEAVAGPARTIPKPAMDLVIRMRNVESLRRLGFIAEHRPAH
jgi:uncharacterized protein YndB with AHSA1/START domain